MRTKSVIVYLVACLVVALIPSDISFAADEYQLFVNPATSQMSKGTSFCVNVRTYAQADEDTGTAVGDFTYPSSKLQVVKVYKNGSECESTNYSHYSLCSTSNCYSHTTGKIQFNATRNPAPGGIAQLFSIKFKAIGSGTANVGFTGGSKVNGVNATLKPGTYTITNPAPTSTPPKTTNPSTPAPLPSPVPSYSPPDPTPAPPQEPEATPDPTGVVQNVTVQAGYDTATVYWDVDAKSSKSTFKYGSSLTSLDKTLSPTKKSDGSFSVPISGLLPGGKYYFTISGSGSGGKKGDYTSTLYTAGYPVAFTVTENGQPAKNATVQIGGVTRVADANGKLTLGLAAGDYSGTVRTETATMNINLTVTKKEIPKDGTAPASQPESYDLRSSIADGGQGSGTPVLVFIGILAVGTVILGVGFVIFTAMRRRQYDTDTVSYTARGPSVIVDDGFDWKNYQPPAQQNSAAAPSPNAPKPPPSIPRPAHNNSVYLDEEEPLDMFDVANKPTAIEPPETVIQPPADAPTNVQGEEDEGSRINISH